MRDFTIHRALLLLVLLRDGERGAPDLGRVGMSKRNVWTGAAFGLFAAGGDAPAGTAVIDWLHVN